MTVDLDEAVFFIYPDADSLKLDYENGKSEENNLNLSKTDFVNAKIKSLWTEIQEIYCNLASEYFWHDEGIHWEVMDKTASPFDTFLHGKVRFGDGIEDEWFLTKFLMKLTAVIPSLVVTVFDSDGDFILIEAADLIPDWLEPENSKNRVFIQGGRIKIISIEDFKSQPSLKEALKFIRSPKNRSVDEKVTRLIEEKVTKEVQKLHKTKVRIPLRVVQILNAKRQLIGPAISSFYNRQPEDMRICTEMPRFNPGKSGGPLVLTTVSMTRIQFAQLACQEFVAPSNDSVDFAMKEGTVENPVAAELGMKLTCGFEILMNTCEPKFISKNLFEEPRAIQEEIDDILNAENPDFTLNDDPEDTLDWMQIDEDILDSELESKLNMNEAEKSDLIDTWTREFEEGKGKLKGELSEIDEIVEKMKKMIGSSSTFEGIEEDEEEEDYSDTQESNLSDDSDNEDFLEREIFETINFDPDLLMKILEANAHMGASNEEFLAKFRKYQQENPVKEGPADKVRQKGLADIEEGKLEEARRSSRRAYKEVEDDGVSESEGDSDSNEADSKDIDSKDLDSADSELDDEFIYGKTLDQLKQESTSITMQTYYEEMEAELNSNPALSQSSDLDESGNLGKNLIESLAAGRGMNANSTVNPMETIISGLGKHSIPRPG